jgi:hypothetical protein
MRVSLVTVLALVFCIATPVVAQEWTEYVNQEDRFSTVFPGEPQVTETTYMSQFGAELSARVYSAEVGQNQYTVTVVDYSPIEAILTKKAEACPAGAETCRGGSGAPGNSTGPGYSKADRQGALVYATWRFMERDATVTHLLWSNINNVEGHQIQLTNNADQSRTFAGVFMHVGKLYIAEGTVRAGYPAPDFFRISLAFLDEDGDSLRYLSYYRDGFPVPHLR